MYLRLRIHNFCRADRRATSAHPHAISLTIPAVLRGGVPDTHVKYLRQNLDMYLVIENLSVLQWNFFGTALAFSVVKFVNISLQTIISSEFIIHIINKEINITQIQYIALIPKNVTTAILLWKLDTMAVLQTPRPKTIYNSSCILNMDFNSGSQRWRHYENRMRSKRFDHGGRQFDILRFEILVNKVYLYNLLTRAIHTIEMTILQIVQ